MFKRSMAAPHLHPNDHVTLSKPTWHTAQQLISVLTELVLISLLPLAELEFSEQKSSACALSQFHFIPDPWRTTESLQAQRS